MSKLVQLRDFIRGYTAPFQHGYFVTIDTHYTKATQSFSYEFLTDFAEKFRNIVRPLNIYTFGRNYRRFEQAKQLDLPINEGHKLAEVTTFEIGEDGRFHLHAMLLHDGSCNRTSEQVHDRLKEICSHTPITRLRGRNALHVQPYDPSKGDAWIYYFTKSYDFFMNRYGFLNIDVS